MRGKYIVDTDVQCMCVMALRHLVVALCVCAFCSVAGFPQSSSATVPPLACRPSCLHPTSL